MDDKDNEILDTILEKTFNKLESLPLFDQNQITSLREKIKTLNADGIVKILKQNNENSKT